MLKSSDNFNIFTFALAFLMASTSKRNLSTWLGIFLRPRAGLKAVLQEGAGTSAFFFMVIGGFVLLQNIFDVKNLNDQYQIGQLMSFSLVFGPATGLLYAALIALLLLNLGCIFDSNHKPKYTSRLFDPSYLFFLLLFWNRWSISFPLALVLFLAARFFEIWNYKGLNLVRMGWSKLCCQIDYYFSFITGSRYSFGQLFSGVGASMGSILLFSLLMLVEFRFMEGRNFSSNSDNEFSILFNILLPLCKVSLFAWFIYSLARLQEIAFKLKFSISLLTSFIAVAIASTVFWFLSQRLIGMTLTSNLF